MKNDRRMRCSRIAQKVSGGDGDLQHQCLKFSIYEMIFKHLRSSSSGRMQFDHPRIHPKKFIQAILSKHLADAWRSKLKHPRKHLWAFTSTSFAILKRWESLDRSEPRNTHVHPPGCPSGPKRYSEQGATHLTRKWMAVLRAYKNVRPNAIGC